ncbi:Hypothetical_protein [Hexamita inflata]|uniref:Hypothetical_protein n=1 Tax=Hexamita inflata TaxID=28002 RepID=A0AA86UEV0_9EUKA|nr:Hypothetical protein HINF_LOCUS36886 [Hexamita inflata]
MFCLCFQSINILIHDPVIMAPHGASSDQYDSCLAQKWRRKSSHQIANTSANPHQFGISLKVYLFIIQHESLRWRQKALIWFQASQIKCLAVLALQRFLIVNIFYD